MINDMLGRYDNESYSDYSPEYIIMKETPRLQIIKDDPYLEPFSVQSSSERNTFTRFMG